MSQLKKVYSAIHDGGTLGTPGTTGSPAIPAHSIPTETTIQITPTNIIDILRNASNSLDPATNPGLLEIFRASNLSEGAANNLMQGVSSGGYYVVVKGSKYIAAEPAVAGSPTIPPTPAQIIRITSSGWGTSARTVDCINHGQFIEFQLSSGGVGVFIGLGFQGMDNMTINAFGFAMIADLSGVWVMENGNLITRLSLLPDSTMKLRIVRQPDQKVVYMVIDGQETMVYISASLASNFPLFGYGKLYTIGDVVKNAEITVGQVQFAKA